MKKQRAERKRRQTDEPLPGNSELERELIAALFVDESASAEAFQFLEERDFLEEVNALIFSELKAAWEAKQPYQTPAVLKQWLISRGADERIKAFCGQAWLEFLSEIIRGGGVGAYIGYYCRELRKLRKRRAAVLASLELLRMAQDGTVEPTQWAERARLYAKRIEKGSSR